MPIADWLPYLPPLYINIGFELGLLNFGIFDRILVIQNTNRTVMDQTYLLGRYKTSLNESKISNQFVYQFCVRFTAHSNLVSPIRMYICLGCVYILRVLESIK